MYRWHWWECAMLVKGVEGTLLIHLKERLPVVLFCPFWSLVLVFVGFKKVTCKIKYLQNLLFWYLYFSIYIFFPVLFLCVFIKCFFFKSLRGFSWFFPFNMKQANAAKYKVHCSFLFVWIYYDMILGNENALLVLWLLIPNKVAVKIKWNNIDEMPNTVLGM